MKKIICIIVLLVIGFNMQSQNISKMIERSLDSHIKMVYEDSDSIVFKKKKLYIMPFLFNIDKDILPIHLRASKLISLTKEREIRKVRNKKRSDKYRGFFSLNMGLENNGNLVVYIQEQLKYYIDGVCSRFEYRYCCDSNYYLLVKQEYHCDKEFETIYEKNVEDKLISSGLYTELFDKHFLSQQTKDKYSDTVNIVHYDDKFYFKYSSEMPKYISSMPVNILYHNEIEDFYDTKYKDKYLLSIDVSINKKGNVLVYLRDIYCNGEWDYIGKTYANSILKEYSYSEFELEYNCDKNRFDIIAEDYISK